MGALIGIYLVTDGEALPQISMFAAEPAFACSNVGIIDGDTFDCGSTRIRLHGIDSPEMPGHCRSGRECTG